MFYFVVSLNDQSSDYYQYFHFKFTTLVFMLLNSSVWIYWLMMGLWRQRYPPSPPCGHKGETKVTDCTFKWSLIQHECQQIFTVKTSLLVFISVSCFLLFKINKINSVMSVWCHSVMSQCDVSVTRRSVSTLTSVCLICDITSQNYDHQVKGIKALSETCLSCFWQQLIDLLITGWMICRQVRWH